MFGHKSLPSIVYSYGALQPMSGLATVQRQLRATHLYRNALVELERVRRDQVASALRALSPDLLGMEAGLAALEDAITTAKDRLAAGNARARHRRATESDRSALRDLRVKRKSCYASVRALRIALFDSSAWTAHQVAIETEITARQKSLRSACGVYWGSYLAVEQGMGAARSGPPPRFRRWRGDGKLAVQCQGGLTVQAFEGAADCRLQLGASRGKARMVRFRIGSDDRAPVWAEVPVIFHRRLPADVTIKWCYLIARRVATHLRWEMQFVVSRASGFRREDLAAHGVVGIDVGWRLVPAGLRVAYWVAADTARDELVIPHKHLSRWSKSESLQSIRDERFNTTRSALHRWLGAVQDAPAWLRRRTETLSQWRSPARLAALILQWREQRFRGDEEIWDELEAWRKKDKHLYEWQANLGDRGIAWRLDLYRRFARDLARRFETAAIEDTDWRTLQRRPGPEAEHGDQAMREYQRIGAPGILHTCLRHAFARVQEIRAANTTQRCSTCGVLMGADAAPLMITCPGCGRVWDQDENAARNLLAAALASGSVTRPSPEAVA